MDVKRYSDLKEALHLSPEISDDDIPSALTALVVTASHDPQSPVSLKDIHTAVSQTGLHLLLEPLDIVGPILLSTDPGADELLALIGEFTSPKETILASEEAIERLAIQLNPHSEEEQQEEEDQYPRRIQAVIRLYAAALPRLKLRRQSPESSLKLLPSLKSVITYSAHIFGRAASRNILCDAASMATKAINWLNTLVSLSNDEKRACKDVLVSFLSSVIEDLSVHLDTKIGLRTFHTINPRLRMPGSLENDWSSDEDALRNIATAIQKLDYHPHANFTKPTTSDLILLAHSSHLAQSDPIKVLSHYLSLIMVLLRSNKNLDEALAILLSTLHRVKAASRTLEEDILVPLTTSLPTLSSSHPDPTTRHLAYRSLSLCISISPPQLRLHILKDLTSSHDDNQFPQLQVAAVGLVKEVILEALERPTSSLASVFLTESIFFPTFGPILFRPNPPNVGEVDKTKFLASFEPSRLTECLGLYYLLLVRDTENRSGVRNKDIRKNIQSSLIGPLKNQLRIWEDSSNSTHNDGHDFSLVALQMGIDRIEEVLQAIDRNS